LFLAIIALVFAAMAFGMAIVLPMVYQERTQTLAERVQVAERENRVTQERYNDIKVELIRRGIPVSDH
jgi:capsular polysaccharide biosynthesis protein